MPRNRWLTNYIANCSGISLDHLERNNRVHFGTPRWKNVQSNLVDETRIFVWVQIKWWTLLTHNKVCDGAVLLALWIANWLELLSSECTLQLLKPQVRNSPEIKFPWNERSIRLLCSVLCGYKLFVGIWLDWGTSLGSPKLRLPVIYCRNLLLSDERIPFRVFNEDEYQLCG